MNVYFEKEFFNHIDFLLMNKFVDCSFNFFHPEIDELKENSIFITLGHWISPNTNHWQNNIKNIKNKSLLVIHHGKSLSEHNIGMLSTVKQLIEEANFNENKVFIVTQLNYDIKNIKNYLPNANILVYDRWLFEFLYYNIEMFQFRPKNWFNITNNIPIKKFSIFCKRYTPDRFEFFCHLISNNLLDNFNYTFVGEYYNDDIVNHINELPNIFESKKNIILEWAKGIPYEVKLELSPNFFQCDKHYPYELKFYLDHSKIHVVLETEPNNTSFITEKTYRAIYHKKLFILVSQYGALEALRHEGYKTFHPYIDESYDTIKNYSDRINAVITELNRLNNMSETELNELVKKCEEIMEYNYNVLHYNVYKNIPENFKFKSMLTF